MATTVLTATTNSTDTPKVTKHLSSTDTKTPRTPMQTSFGCQHVKSLLQNARGQAIDNYNRALQSIHRPGNVSDSFYKTGTGTNVTGKTTFLCLQCPAVLLTSERHRKEHAFAVESTNGFMLCHECHDFVYDPAFEELRLAAAPNGKKRKHEALVAEPGEKRQVATNSIPSPCAATGLRGLYNMGQTCFMSVILQSLIHNPFIRAFYLNEGHKSADCDRDACTSCAMDEIFTDFYGQEKHEGYGAVHMLQGCWKGGGGLAGYSQQDAHEYLGFILNNLHTANTEDEDDPLSSSRDAKTCDCIIHQTFGGLYRSTVTCSTCKNVTTTFDPFTDLSLDIKAPAVVTKKKKLAAANGVSKEAAPMDLTECLDRFTSPETLSADSYTCRKCNKPQEAEKRLRLHSLPPVVPVHLKRFSHSKTLDKTSKVDTKIRFPFTVNFGPYTTAAAVAANSRKKKATEDKKGDESDKEKSAPQIEPYYCLSSVIVHKGKIDNGHYVSYSRQDEEWFRFDDSMVVQVDEKEVLGAEAYMLFYVIQDLDTRV